MQELQAKKDQWKKSIHSDGVTKTKKDILNKNRQGVGASLNRKKGKNESVFTKVQGVSEISIPKNDGELSFIHIHLWVLVLHITHTQIGGEKVGSLSTEKEEAIKNSLVKSMWENLKSKVVSSISNMMYSRMVMHEFTHTLNN